MQSPEFVIEFFGFRLYVDWMGFPGAVGHLRESSLPCRGGLRDRCAVLAWIPLAWSSRSSRFADILPTITGSSVDEEYLRPDAAGAGFLTRREQVIWTSRPYPVVARSAWISYYGSHEKRNRPRSEKPVRRSAGSGTASARQHHAQWSPLGGDDFRRKLRAAAAHGARTPAPGHAARRRIFSGARHERGRAGPVARG